MALRLRRGTDAERLLITPLQGELIYATDTKKLYVGDGATQGGVLVGPVDDTATDLINDTTPQLGGDLDLNGNNITGAGNINIDGTITATGNINLGDAGTDEITVAGVINSNLRPAIDSAYDLGSQSRRWNNVFATGINVDGQTTVDRLAVRSNIEGADSSVLYDAGTDSLAVSTIRAASIYGDFNGSVFSDDSSTIIVDSLNRVINIDTINLNTLPLTTAPGTDTLTIGSTANPAEVIINSDAAAIGLNVIGETSAFGGNVPIMSISTHRGTFDVPETVQVGDGVGGILLRSHDGSAYQNTAIISGDVVDTSGPNIDVKLVFATFNGFSNNDIVEINSDGRLSASQIKTGSFATLDLPATPDAGTIVFDSDTSEFKGWNGSSWVVLG